MNRFLWAAISIATLSFGGDWMQEQIEADFSAFEKNLSLSMLQETMKDPHLVNMHGEIAYVEIKDGHFSIKESVFTGWDYVRDRMERVSHEINEWQKTAKIEERLPDCVFLLSFSDGLDIDACHGFCYPDAFNVPVFVFSKRPSSKKLILFPDHGAMSPRTDVLKAVEGGNRTYPWEKKKEVLFWRGAGTDGEYTKEEWKKRPRAHLTLLAKANPDLMDAGLTVLPQVNGQAALHDILTTIGGMKPILSIQEHMSYKYLMDVDGNSNGWDRCFWGLLSNSALFKQEGKFQQWYYKALKPWEHYIPVKEHLEDLKGRIEWAKKHDVKVREIAEKGRAVALEVFDRKAVFEYMRRVLTEYKKHFK